MLVLFQSSFPLITKILSKANLQSYGQVIVVKQYYLEVTAEDIPQHVLLLRPHQGL